MFGVGVMPLALVVAKLNSYLIFITYLVSFCFHSRLASILLDIYLLFVDKSVSFLYVPHDSMLCLSMKFMIPILQLPH